MNLVTRITPQPSESFRNSGGKKYPVGGPPLSGVYGMGRGGPIMGSSNKSGVQVSNVIHADSTHLVSDGGSSRSLIRTSAVNSREDSPDSMEIVDSGSASPRNSQSSSNDLAEYDSPFSTPEGTPGPTPFESPRGVASTVANASQDNRWGAFQDLARPWSELTPQQKQAIRNPIKMTLDR